ncbi:MAG: cation diffusion facilitator family transporter [Gammaproteobacteria bacterium]|nr:cation diffusion facilitator family transporter [Gammaproteobacteria bacterium]
MSHGHHHHPIQQEENSGSERHRAMQRVTLVGAVVNLILATVKIVIGYMGQSQALVADGVHSISDLATDAMVLFASKHSSKEADEDHPYGHGRIETAFTVALGAFLVLVAIGIAWDAAERLFHPDELLMPGMLAMAGAVFSVLANEGLYHYTMQVARELKSNLLKANAWHHRSDAISSVVVIIGIGGTMAGLPYLDSVAAVAVALMIAKIGWDLVWQSVHELVDTSLDQERVEEIRVMIMDIDGVVRVHELRTRKMGGEALVDLHIEVEPHLSVSEAHYISECVRQKVVAEFDEVLDVLVHIDPEDDEKVKPSAGLPTRKEVERQLWQVWAGEVDVEKIERITLHYLSGSIEVELLMQVEAADEISVKQSLINKALTIEWVKSVKIYLIAP